MGVLLMMGLGTPTERFLTGSDGARHSPIPTKTRRQSRVGSRLSVFSLEASLNHIFFPQKTSQLPAWQACLQVDFLRKLTALRTMRFWSPFFGPWNMESKEISELFVLSIHNYGFTWIVWLSSTKVDIHMPEDDFNAKDSRVETFRTWCHRECLTGSVGFPEVWYAWPVQCDFVLSSRKCGHWWRASLRVGRPCYLEEKDVTSRHGKKKTNCFLLCFLWWDAIIIES